MPSESTSLRAASSRAFRRILPWALALSVATCTDDQNGPSHGGTGYFSFRPVYGISNSLSQFGVVADSVRVLLTRPVDQVVLDTTVFFPADSSELHLALPVQLETSPETLSAVIEISAGGTVIFVDSVDVRVVDGPPSPGNIPTVVLDYVGPGKNIAAITVSPRDTTIFLRDTLFFTATAQDSSAQPVASFYVAWKTSDTSVAKINAQGRLIAPNARGNVRVIGYTPTGIADSITVTFAPVPVIITADSGNAQAGLAGDSLGSLFVARVKGSDSLGISGVAVRFAAVTAGGAVRDTLLITDVNGRVRTRGVLGTLAAGYSYSATVVGTALTRTFTATATAGAASAIAIQSGNAQVDTTGRLLGLPLTVRVADGFNNPVSGAKVYWSRPVGTGTRSADSSFTNASGLASITYTLGTAGVDSIRADLAGTSAFVLFNATAVPGAPASILTLLGDTQTVTVGTQATDTLTVAVRDALNQPVVGVNVDFSVIPAVGGLVVLNPTGVQRTVSDSLGVARAVFTAGTAVGTVRIEAQAGSVIDSIFVLQVAAAPTVIAIGSGDAQTDTVGNVIPLPFVAHVTDAFGNPVAGAMVLFTRLAGSGNLAADSVATNASGNAAVGYHFGFVPGVDTIRATLSGTAAFVDFTATAIPGTPASAILVSGSGQSAVAGTAYTDSLVVEVLDVNDNPMVNGAVVWTLDGNGSLSADTTYTDLNGRTWVRVTAGTVSGIFGAHATPVGTALTANYVLNVLAGAPSTIAIVSGNGQSDTTGHTLPLPFVAGVTDDFGNPTVGATVVFAVIAGNGNTSADTVVTDSAGLASVTFTLGATPATDTVRASLVGTSAFVDFTTDGVSGAAAFLNKLLGDNQTDTVLSTLTDSLVVQLTDAGATPVPNTWLYWLTAGATLSSDSTLTDSTGRAAVQVTFDNIAIPVTVVVHNVDTTIATVFVLHATAGVPTQITAVGGLGQTAAVSTALPIDFGAFVQDAYGNPAQAGIAVTWNNLAGFTAAGLPDTTLTDSTGVAFLTAPLLGPIVGEDSLVAQILGQPDTAIFTATATAGGASALVYVSGTGQTDTVGQTLPSPFVVQVRDAGNNPVAGAWVTWLKTSGGGSLVGIVGQDSVQTDASGVATVDLVVGTNLSAGIDSAIAFVQGLGDTVSFYAVGLPDSPVAITVFSGNNQAAAVNAALDSVLVARILDQYGNPIVGATVDFTDLTGSGIGFLNNPASTNSVGIAGSGTVTLGATAGSMSVAATTPVLPGDTAFFTVIALPLGSSAQWQGTLSSNWGTAGNWSPAVVPTTSDNVFVPASAPNQPVLDVARTIGGLQLEAGATTDLGAFNLTLVGNATIAGTMSRTTGFLILNGTGATVQGQLPATRVTGTLTLAGPTTVQDSLTATSGSLVVGGRSLTVNGALSTSGTAAFTMQNPGDSVDVAGKATINGSTATGLLTTGVLVVRGSTFSAPSGSSTFQPSGNHRVVFAGSAPQTWTSGNSGVASDRFQNVDFANATGVTLGSNVYVTGNAQVLAGTVTGVGRTVTIASTLIDSTNVSWLPTTTLYIGAPASLPDSFITNVNFSGSTVTLAKDITFKGTVDFSGAGATTLNGFNLRADSTMTIGNSHQMIVQNAADTVEAMQTLVWSGSTTTGLITDGVILARGNFSAPSGSTTFQPTGTNRVVFAGSAPQTWSSGNSGIAGDRFQEVDFANAAGVDLGSNVYVTGTARVLAGTVTGVGRTVTFGGTLVDSTNVSWLPTNTVYTGTPASLLDSFVTNVNFAGSTITLAKDITFKGTVDFSGAGATTLNGFNLRADSTMTISNSHQMIVQNPADTVEAMQTLVWNGSTTSGLVTTGVILARGNFSAPSGSTTFQPTGGNRVVFAGSAPQTWSSGNSGIAGDRFQEVDFANAAGVNFGSNVYVTGTAHVLAGTVTGAGRTVTFGGTLIDSTNVSWLPTNLVYTGTPASLLDSFVSNVNFAGSTISLAKDITFKGTVDFTGAGATTLNGFNLLADSTLTISNSHQVIMQNVADTLEARQVLTWSGSTATGLLTAGVIIAHGNMSAPSGSSTFQPSGTHKVVFTGATPQSWSSGNSGAAGDRFQDVDFANADSVNLGSNVYVTGQARVLSGTVTGAGRTVTMAGILIDSTSVAWQPTTTAFAATPASLPDSFARNVQFNASVTLAKPLAIKGNLSTSGPGALALNGFPLRIDSTLSVTGSYQLLMQNSADSLDVGGLATINGSTTAGLMTTGVIVLRGGLSAPTGSVTFQPSGTHRVVFAGGGAQSVNFSGNSSFTGNRFAGLELGAGSTVSLLQNTFATGALSKPAGANATISGTALRTLNVRGFAVDGLVFDSVRVDYSGPATPQFDNVSFLRQDPTLVALTMRTPGSPAPVTFSNLVFGTAPSTGRYISVTDTLPNSQAASFDLVASTPLDGTAFEVQAPGADGAVINWTSFAFSDQPVNTLIGATLAPVRVALINPAGDTATFFTGNVTIALGANPGNATLTGTTTVAAVAGVATFSDLAVDSGGLGYTLTASAAGLPTVTSALFDVTVSLPSGFDVSWLGGISNDWFVPGNWSTGTVPDSSTNVFISNVTPNDPNITAVAKVNRIRLTTGAALNIQAGGSLTADSSVQSGGDISGGGLFTLRGNGDLTGTVTAPIRIDGTYSVVGTAAIQFLDIYGDLYLAADTLTVSGAFGTNGGTGRILSTSPDALIDDAGPATFAGGSTTGTLVEGTLRVGGFLSAPVGGAGDAFAPSGGFTTILNGSGVQDVDFTAPDSAIGSHFGILQVNTVGTAFMHGRYDALGDLLIANGATLADSVGAGFEAHGFTTIDAGGTLAVNSLRTRGGIGVAVGGTYSVATTTYYDGVGFPINPAPYDTLILEMGGQATGDFAIGGDLRLTGTGAGFDLNGHTVSVSGNVDIENGATLTMQNAADILNVTGSFFTNGGTTTGLLTNGVLQIGGDFRQAADGSGESFRASGGHTTRFTGGPGTREIKFDSPSISSTDLGGSHFAILDLPDGVDSISGRVAAAGAVTVGGAVTYDSTTSNNQLATYGGIDILASSDSVHIQTLETWAGLTKAGAGLYGVGLTRLWGGAGTLPALPYNDLSIAYTSVTMGGDQVVTGSLSLGIFCSEVCTSAPGELIVGGHTLTVGDQLSVLGLGMLTMAAGDSVDVTGDMTWRGAANDGHLTGGTLVARGLFNMVGSDVFQADAAHRTVLLAPGVQDIYPAANSWFGKLYVLDGAPRRIRTSSPLVVHDSLVLGSVTAALSDTFGFSTGQIVAQGPVFTVVGSSITMGGSVRFDHNSFSILGDYSAATTIFGGTGQTIPNLTYTNSDIQVIGTALLGSVVDIGSGTFTVDGSAGAADLDLNGHRLQAAAFNTTGSGTLTMTDPADSLIVGASAGFDGGNETGKITDGVFRFHGTFAQVNTNSDSSFVATGSNTTWFTDSTGFMAVNAASMATGASRFNDVMIDGNGVGFNNPVWIGGNVAYASASVDQAQGPFVTIGGTLTEPSSNVHWTVDTTRFLSRNTVLPDSMLHDVILAGGDTLTGPVHIGGTLEIQDTVVVNGYTLQTHGALEVTGIGLLQMTNSTDQVMVDSTAIFDGAPSNGYMTAGRLVLTGNVGVGHVGAFDATGTHVTVLNAETAQAVDFVGRPQGYGFNDLVTYSTQVAFDSGVVVHGTFRDSVTSGTLTLTGSVGDLPALVASRVEITGAQFTDLSVTMGLQSQLDTAAFSFTAPSLITQILVVDGGQATPLDLHAITFNDWSGAQQLVRTVDTLSNGQGVKLRMFGSTPFDGSSKSVTFDPADPGLSAVSWSHLTLQSALPLTVDSATPFDLTLVVQEPDSTNRADVIGTADLTLAANPGGATLTGGTTANFDGQSGTFNNLVLTGVSIGTSFHIEMQGRAIDSFTTGTLDILNPAPVGSIAFTGATSNDWSDPTNWSTTTVPTTADSVFIPGGMSPTIPAGPAFNVNTLVLGQGAALDIASGATLNVFGDLAAGHTITGFGDLVLAGGNRTVTGIINAPTVIAGAVTAVGTVSFGSNLTVDGASGEFNVGGAKVDVSGNFYTSNGGLLTMDGAADTLYVGSVSFGGGDETGHLTDGVLIIQGNSFDQAFGDPNSFRATLNHTTIFADGGSAMAVNISDPYASQFANVKVQNTNGVDFNESGNNIVRLVGGLAVSAGGSMTGDTVKVDGIVTTDASSTVALGVLATGSTPTLAGTYTVGTTYYFGSPFTIPDAPQGYDHLYIDNAASLGDSVNARHILITGNGSLDVNGFTLVTDTLRTSSNASLLMNAAEDTVVVDSLAQFNGADTTGALTAGLLVINGWMDVPDGLAFQAQPGHLTRFQGTGTDSVVLNQFCEGGCYGMQFGALDITADTVNFIDNGDYAVHVEGALTVSGTLVAEIPDQRFFASGGMTVTSVGQVAIQNLFLTSSGTPLDYQGTDSTQYRVEATRYTGSGQTVSLAPYNELDVTGSAGLGAAIVATNGNVTQGGHLDLGGYRLDISNSLVVGDSAHLLMQSAADTLWVGGTAFFTGISGGGDLSAGVVRARNFRQQTGTTGQDTSFVQTGTAKVVMLAGDTLRMVPNGPLGSRLRMLDLDQATDTVWFGDMWITDSLLATNAATTGHAFGEGVGNIVVSGTAIWYYGKLDLESLAVGGSLTVGPSAIYNVGLTKFVGNGMSIPNGITYKNIEVQYAATLTGNIDLDSAAGDVLVANSGDLDLNGHTLRAINFSTTGYGRLTMASTVDSLVAFQATFAGDSTNLSLTAGTIVTQFLDQQGSISSKSYAPSGTHRLVLADLGSAGDGVSANFATPGVDSSHVNLLSATNYGMILTSPVVAMDTMFIDVFVSQGTGQSLIAHGPMLFGANADITLDSLFIFDTLVTDNAGSYSLHNTIFGAGAKPMPADLAKLEKIIIDGTQTLSDFSEAFSDVLIRTGGTLTLGGNYLKIDGVLRVNDSGRVVLQDASDTLQFYGAYFDGFQTGSDLSAGLIRVDGYLSQVSDNSPQSFRPTGTTVEFGGLAGGDRYTTFDDPDSSASRFLDLRIKDNTFLRVQSGLAVAGQVTVESGSELDAGYQAVGTPPIDFYGKVDIQSSARISDSLVSVVTFHDTLTVGLGASYNIFNTAFQNTNGIPDVSYQYLYLQDGVHDTLTHDLNASFLSVYASGVGNEDLVLNGHTVNAGGFSSQQYGRFSMVDANDSMIVAGNATFDGGDLSGLLTDGFLRFGADVAQTVSTSNLSLRTDGVRVEFYGATSHQLSFATPDTSASYLGNVAIMGGSNLYPNTATAFKGRVDVGTGSTLDLGTLTAAQSDFYGPVTVASGGALLNSNSGGVGFRDTLLVDPAATYNVQWTAFFEIDTIPNLPYHHLAIRDGSHISLAEDLSITGILDLNTSTPGTQDFDLNGHTMFVGGTVQTQLYGRLTMHSPLDSLRMNGNAQFWGGEETGLLTNGVIEVGGNFSQQASYSLESFQSTGTRVRFWDTGTQQVTFATPDSSWFAEVTDAPGGTLDLNFTTDAQVKGYLDATAVTLTGDPGVTLRADSIRSVSAALNVSVPRVITAKVSAYILGSWTTPYTEYLIPVSIAALGYDTLVVSGGGGFISTNVTAQTVIVNGTLEIENGNELHATGDVTVNNSYGWLEIDGGGTLTVDGTFHTVNGGSLISHSVSSGMSAGSVDFSGGTENGLLTAGGMDLTGSFHAADNTFFADSLYTVNFTGGGNHAVTLDGSSNAAFGILSIGAETTHGDTLDISGTLATIAYAFNATGTPLIIGNGISLNMERLGVNGADFDHVLINQFTNSEQPLQFDNVTFTGYGSADVQLAIGHPGASILSPFTFDNVDFDDAASPNGTTGFFIQLDDTDGILNFLHVIINGPDYSIGSTLDNLLNGSLITWNPPS